jgi:hypothetical protein
MFPDPLIVRFGLVWGRSNKYQQNAAWGRGVRAVCVPLRAFLRSHLRDDPNDDRRLRMIESLLSALVKSLVIGTGRGVLKLFGFKNPSEVAGFLAGLGFWIVIGLNILVLVH